MVLITTYEKVKHKFITLRVIINYHYKINNRIFVTLKCHNKIDKNMSNSILKLV